MTKLLQPLFIGRSQVNGTSSILITWSGWIE
jgi:hypothetical protein